MKYFMKTSFAVACLAFVAITPVAADPKPKGAKPLDAQSVANAYGGKTNVWKSCNGGIYFGAKFEAQAWCAKKGDSTGLGKWSVTKKGQICYDLVWYWQTDDGYGSKPQDKKECINHLIDGNGQIWRNWTGQKDWWKFDAKSDPKGFKYKRKINRLRKKIGV